MSKSTAFLRVFAAFHAKGARKQPFHAAGRRNSHFILQPFGLLALRPFGCAQDRPRLRAGPGSGQAKRRNRAKKQPTGGGAKGASQEEQPKAIPVFVNRDAALARSFF